MRLSGLSTPIVCLLIVLCMQLAHSLEFEMSSLTKCMYEEINANVLVAVDYHAFHKDTHDPIKVDLTIEDPNYVVLAEKRALTDGQYAFTSKDAGEYRACFRVQDLNTAYQTKVKLDWKTGVAANDWDSIAKKEHLTALETELRKLGDEIQEVYSEMLQLQEKEQEMREISEVTNTRIAMYSILSLAVCGLSCTWQLWHLRRVFTRKKLM